MNKLESKDRIYKLKRNATPLSYLLPREDKRRNRLLYFDKDKNVSRALRYAANQRSPFVDEQDDNILIEEIEFIDGWLRVPATNPALQLFLHYTPDNGKKFVEVDSEKDASEELERMDMEDMAINKAREICGDVETLEMVARILFAKDVSNITTAELKRDVRIYAKRRPQQFLELVEDGAMDLKATVQAFFDSQLLKMKNGGKDVYYNLPDSKRRMLVVPNGKNPQEAVIAFLTSKDGVEVLKILERHLND